MSNETGRKDEFLDQATSERSGLVGEFWHFLKHNKKWWLLPIVIVMLRAIWDFKEFDLIYLLTGGGPITSTQTLPLLVYKEAFALNQMGMATAYAVIMMLIMLVFMILYIRRTRSEEA